MTKIKPTITGHGKHHCGKEGCKGVGCVPKHLLLASNTPVTPKQLLGRPYTKQEIREELLNPESNIYCGSVNAQGWVKSTIEVNGVNIGDDIVSFFKKELGIKGISYDKETGEISCRKYLDTQLPTDKEGRIISGILGTTDSLVRTYFEYKKVDGVIIKDEEGKKLFDDGLRSKVDLNKGGVTLRSRMLLDLWAEGETDFEEVWDKLMENVQLSSANYNFQIDAVRNIITQYPLKGISDVSSYDELLTDKDGHGRGFPNRVEACIKMSILKHNQNAGVIEDVYRRSLNDKDISQPNLAQTILYNQNTASNIITELAEKDDVLSGRFSEAQNWQNRNSGVLAHSNCSKEIKGRALNYLDNGNDFSTKLSMGTSLIRNPKATLNEKMEWANKIKKDTNYKEDNAGRIHEAMLVNPKTAPVEYLLKEKDLLRSQIIKMNTNREGQFEEYYKETLNTYQKQIDGINKVLSEREDVADKLATYF